MKYPPRRSEKKICTEATTATATSPKAAIGFSTADRGRKFFRSTSSPDDHCRESGNKVAGETPGVLPDAQGRMATSVAPSASRAAVALVAYADFVNILILVVRDAVTEHRGRGVLRTSPVRSGSRK